MTPVVVKRTNRRMYRSVSPRTALRQRVLALLRGLSECGIGVPALRGSLSWVVLLVRDSWGHGGLRSEYPLGLEVGGRYPICGCSSVLRFQSRYGAGPGSQCPRRLSLQRNEENVNRHPQRLSAAQWRRAESFLLGRAGWVGVTDKDSRNFVKGVPRLCRGQASGYCVARPIGMGWPPEAGRCLTSH